MSHGWHFIKEVVIKTCWLTPVVITVNDLLAGVASVRGRSMQPTFNPVASNANDIVLVDKLSIRLYKYSRGDVVCVRSALTPYRKDHLCPVFSTDSFASPLCSAGPL